MDLPIPIITITGEDEVELKSLMGAAMMQERVSSYRVIVSSTKSFLRMSSSTSAFRSRSCENLVQIQPPGSFHLFHSHLEDVESTDEAAEDDRLRVVTEMLQSEQTYCDSLRSLFDNYAEPLRKFSSLEKEDHQILFVGMEPIYSISASLVKKLEQAIEIWDSTSTKIGSFFSSKFWSVYEAYYETCIQAKQFLEVKLKTDKVLENFCQLREQNGLPGLEALLMLPVKRIPEYEKYLTELLQGTPEAHPDYEQLSRSVKKVQDMVKDCDDDLRGADNENKMDAVQDRFPHDDLQLQKRKKHRSPEVCQRADDQHPVPWSSRLFLEAAREVVLVYGRSRIWDEKMWATVFSPSDNPPTSTGNTSWRDQWSLPGVSRRRTDISSSSTTFCWSPNRSLAPHSSSSFVFICVTCGWPPVWRRCVRSQDQQIGHSFWAGPPATLWPRSKMQKPKRDGGTNCRSMFKNKSFE
ncbi:rho guanine nucleotide exchange factor 10-like isoform X3 [Pomacea canaliculata]|uniref:rho guanine nucleotide exchange factor 10-like isoform X3 n=1 Tax=Pomacea canaliculata TaxID=400727 RepID=UPI000D733805|nr:rho guanine nucleotide exchange factor 10-like isoform X3 [Pomacea canaliculata]